MAARSAMLSPGRPGWVGNHRALYTQSGGTEGHIVDLTDVGGHVLTTHCLIRHTGRRSGRTMVTPLIYGDVGGEVVIVASNGGADHHPAWYWNLRSRETVDLQIATQAFRSTWREPEDDEREQVWMFMVSVFPPYAQYQATTSRQIPIVMLRAVVPIGLFAGPDTDFEERQ